MKELKLQKKEERQVNVLQKKLKFKSWPWERMEVKANVGKLIEDQQKKDESVLKEIRE